MHLDNQTGVFDWTPDYVQAGTYAITFTATTNMLSDSKSITITVFDMFTPIVDTSVPDSVTDISAILKATVNANGLPTDAWFEWGETLAFGNTTISQSAGSSIIDVNISQPIGGLLPSTNYYFRVVALNSSGVAYGGAKVLTTKPISFVKIETGNLHSLALRSDGTLWAWGSNTSGQLGDGSTARRLAPVQIGADADWLDIFAGGDHSFALKNNKTLWAWGDNSYGQLGNGTSGNKLLAPAQVNPDVDWVIIYAAPEHTLALKANGSLWAWGNNTYGQLGDGTKLNQLAPELISGTVWTAVSA
jgi:hypothetical protein